MFYFIFYYLFYFIFLLFIVTFCLQHRELAAVVEELRAKEHLSESENKRLQKVHVCSSCISSVLVYIVIFIAGKPRSANPCRCTREEVARRFENDRSCYKTHNSHCN